MKELKGLCRCGCGTVVKSKPGSGRPTEWVFEHQFMGHLKRRVRELLAEVERLRRELEFGR